MNQEVLARLFELYSVDFVIHRVKRTYSIYIPVRLPLLACFEHVVVWRRFRGVWEPGRTPTEIARIVLRDEEEPFRKIQIYIYKSSDNRTRMVVETEYVSLTLNELKKLLDSVLPWRNRILVYCYTSALELATSVSFDPRPLLDKKAQQGILEGPWEKSGKRFYVFRLRKRAYLVVVYKGEEFNQWKVEVIFLTKYEDSAGEFGIFNEPVRNERAILSEMRFILEFVLDPKPIEATAYEYLLKYHLIPRMREDKSLREQVKQIVKRGYARGRKLTAYGALFVSGYQYIALRNWWMLLFLKKALKANLRGGPSPNSLRKNRKLYLKLSTDYEILKQIVRKLADARARKGFSPWIVKNWQLLLSILSQAVSDLEKLLSEVEKEMPKKEKKIRSIIDLVVIEAVEEKKRKIERAKERFERRHRVGDSATATRDGANDGANSALQGDGNIKPNGGARTRIIPASSLSSSEDNVKIQYESPIFQFLKPKYLRLVSLLEGKAKSIILNSMEYARKGLVHEALEETWKLGTIPISNEAYELLQEIRRELRLAIRERRKRFEEILTEAERLFHQGKIEEARTLLLENKRLAKSFNQWRKLNAFLGLIKASMRGVGQGAEVRGRASVRGKEEESLGRGTEVQAGADMGSHRVLEGRLVHDKKELHPASGKGCVGASSEDNKGSPIVDRGKTEEAGESQREGETVLRGGHKEAGSRSIRGPVYCPESHRALRGDYRNKSQIRAEILEKIDEISKACPALREKVGKLKSFLSVGEFSDVLEAIRAIEREHIPTRTRIILAQLKYLFSLLKK